MSEDEIKTIFRQHAQSIYRLCFRYVGVKADAEDLVQEIFLIVSRKLPEFRRECKLATWIYRIAVNHCLEHLRQKWRRNRLDIENLHPLVLRNLSPEDDRILARIDLEKVLSGLKADTRRILFLACAEGLSYEEISEVTGIGKSAVAKIVTRFKEKVQASRRFQGSGWGTARRDNAIR